jgi:hypothetical protein
MNYQPFEELFFPFTYSVVRETFFVFFTKSKLKDSSSRIIEKIDASLTRVYIKCLLVDLNVD